MNISIMGCGWLGFPLAKLLIEKGHHVKGSTTTASKLPLLREAGIEAYQVKIDGRRASKLNDFLEGSELLIINIPPKRRNPDVERAHPMQINVLVEKAQQAGVQKILFVSSTGVYGNEGRILTESDTPRPQRASGRALVRVEWALQQLEGVGVTIVRMAGLVGGTRKAGRFLAAKKEVPNGDALVNLVHQLDCMHILEQIIAQEKWGEIFNVCADEHPTRRDFYTYQARKEGLEPPTFLVGDAVKFKIVSNAKIKRVLNYSFQYPDPMKF